MSSDLRRQEHHRHPVGGEPGQDPVQVDVHVRGVGVHLVDDDDLAGQPQVAHDKIKYLFAIPFPNKIIKIT